MQLVVTRMVMVMVMGKELLSGGGLVGRMQFRREKLKGGRRSGVSLVLPLRTGTAQLLVVADGY
jgi:hypothetical protein